jgi:hypothetical protein
MTDRKWPREVPEELGKRLTETLSMRSIGAADIWGTVYEWLVSTNSVPGNIPEKPTLPPFRS